MPLVLNLFERISAQKGSSKVAVNTFLIYGQRISAAFLSLVTTPIVLNALGVEDYGLYTLTIGFVGMLAFINWSLSSATQRFIGFYLGAEDRPKLKKVFSSSLLIHGIYAAFLLILIWSFAGLVVDKFLTIPESRINTAILLIKLVSFITFFNIIRVPFLGLFRAYENFLYLSIVGIVESVLKLGAALALLLIESDLLIAFALLILSITFLIFITNVLFSRRFYDEVNFKIKHFDKDIIKEMMGFTGWSLMGAISVMSRNQGVSVLLNIFFGVVANAAYGIAMQVNAAITILSHGIIGSISPRIVKSAGAGDQGKMIYLMRAMSKLAVISVSFVAIPFLIEAPYILHLWLKNVPEGAILFSRLSIVFALLMLLSAGIKNVFSAIGKVKLYNIWVSLILMLNLPLAYLLFKIGYPAYTIILTGIFLELISLFVRIYLLKRYLSFSVSSFIKDIIFKIALPISILVLSVLLVKQFNLDEFPRLIITFVLIIFIYPIIIYAISFDQIQKAFVTRILTNLMKRVKEYNFYL